MYTAEDIINVEVTYVVHVKQPKPIEESFTEVRNQPRLYSFEDEIKLVYIELFTFSISGFNIHLSTGIGFGN